MAKIVKFETEQNSLAQSGRRSNIVFSGIPESLDDNNLDNTFIFMMSDVNVNIEVNFTKISDTNQSNQYMDIKNYILKTE